MTRSAVLSESNTKTNNLEATLRGYGIKTIPTTEIWKHRVDTVHKYYPGFKIMFFLGLWLVELLSLKFALAFFRNTSSLVDGYRSTNTGHRWHYRPLRWQTDAPMRLWRLIDIVNKLELEAFVLEFQHDFILYAVDPKTKERVSIATWSNII